MKIVVSGSGGIGKTTLINYISPILINYKVIPDFIDEEVKNRGYNSLKELSDLKIKEIRLSALEKKIKTESESRNFLSDKGVIDYLAYWLIWSFPHATEEENFKFLEATRNHIHIYDLIIIPPFGRYKIEKIERRSSNWYHQYRIHALIKGLYTEFGLSWKEFTFNIKKAQIEIIKELGIKRD